MSYNLRAFLLALLAICMLKIVCQVRSYGGSGSHSSPHIIHPEPERGTPWTAKSNGNSSSKKQ
jgi:hypothetical protein